MARSHCAASPATLSPGSRTAATSGASRTSLPYYRRLESDPEGGDFHGQSGPIPIERPAADSWQPLQRAFYDACLDNGFNDIWDHNLPDATGVGPWPRNRSNGNRISTNIAYLLGIRDRENLTIRHGVLVDKLSFDGDQGARVNGVILSDGEVIHADRVCVSAGTAVSPAILMRSGIGPAEKLSAHGIKQRVPLPGVGENLIDHCGTGVQAFPKADVVHDPDIVTEVGVRYTAPGSDQFNDMQLAISTILGRGAGARPDRSTASASVVRHRRRDPASAFARLRHAALARSQRTTAARHELRLASRGSAPAD